MVSLFYSSYFILAKKKGCYNKRKLIGVPQQNIFFCCNSILCLLVLLGRYIDKFNDIKLLHSCLMCVNWGLIISMKLI